MLFAMIAKDKPGSGEQRIAVRPVHLDHLNSTGDRLVLAGALLNETGAPEGSLMVIEAETIEDATASFLADPFIDAGIFASYEIKPRRLAINNMTKKD
ncbi:YciI family protein [Devosia sp. A8/3-2]|nr:YciI family protein [Devosia sp. A8/3-2]